MLKIATDCTGIGSPEQAIKNLGIEHEVVFACEKDKFARLTYTANFKAKEMFDDITTRDNCPPHLYSDLYVAGFPCQAFSLSGKRKGFDDIRGTIFFNCADYIEKQRPKYFILENVKGLLSHDKPKGSKAKHGRTFQTIINILGQTINGQMLFSYYEDALDYNLHYRVLNTKDYGIPQNRERVFIIGIRNDLPNEFNFPKTVKLEKRLKDILEKEVEEKYFLSDKMCDYLLKRKDNFNNGKINFKEGDDIASTITSSSSSLDLSDNIIIVNDNGILKEQKEHTNCIDANYAKGMDNHQQRSVVLVEDPKIVALRGRGEKGNIEQQLEERKDGLTNTLTSVEKDNYVVVHSLFPRSSKTGKGGTGHLTKNDGTSFCVDTTNSQAIELTDPKIISYTRDKEGNITNHHLKDEANTIHGGTGGSGNTDQYVSEHNVPIELNKIDSLYDSDSDAGRIYSSEGLSTTLKAQGGGGGAKTGLYEIKGRIRKLTPLECFRLQGFPDDYVKPVSNSQLYKQAGNSITVAVIQGVIKNLVKL